MTLVAHLADVPPGLGRVEQRQRRAVGAGMLERVVELVDRLRQDRIPAADVAQQPELFLVADVREVPDQRRHQPGVLADQVGVVHRLGQQPRCAAGRGPGRRRSGP